MNENNENMDKIDKLEGESLIRIKNIRAFLYRLARNIVADYYRSLGKYQVVSYEENSEILKDNLEFIDFKEKAMVSLEIDKIRRAISSLPEDYQDFIIWHYLDELSVPEIAEITGKTENNVRVGLHRAVKYLRDAIFSQENQ